MPSKINLKRVIARLQSQHRAGERWSVFVNAKRLPLNRCAFVVHLLLGLRQGSRLSPQRTPAAIGALQPPIRSSLEVRRAARQGARGGLDAD